ncbi:hypothetical protein HYC85_020176 [Camellia sinensis]|uniref:Methyltransferase n=1 Tax=Camellia sinensis TaxID=4442 RepID=A0A7J7GSW1_CAMSI|nr:hypothetical protein HYC85_020176 [Camellia sinensis]
MSRPLHRGVSGGGRFSGNNHVFWNDSELKDKTDKEDHHIAHGSARLRELEYCPEQSENYVPCFNVTENVGLGFSGGEEHDRHCAQGSRQNCLVLTPVNYKIPLRWPTGKDVIWVANVKISAEEVLSSGSLTKRMMMLDKEQISFRSASLMFDGVEDYSHQIAEMIGLRNESNFLQAGVRTILDIGCGYGSFGAHLFSKQLLTMCIANYEASGSQVQLTLERGLPAMIGSYASKQFPYPSLSFDMVHCSRCGIDWDQKEGLLLIEADRVLRPGGYFVWTSPLTNAPSSHRNNENQKRWKSVLNFAESLCWEMLAQQDETVVWKKTSLHPEDLAEDSQNWNFAVRNYWSLLSPLIFSDHPKRPGDEDPSPPYNMLRNVLDMNARFGGFNSALLEAGKSVWVMNVVPTDGPNSLPLILDRGFVGVLHDWCEAFPTYPRTYDMVHAEGLLSLQTGQHRRPEAFEERTWETFMGWVILRDSASIIETSRALTTRLKWDARVIDIESNSDEKILICQKPLFRRQVN